MERLKKGIIILIVLFVIPVLFLSLNSYAAKVETDPLVNNPLIYSKNGKTYTLRNKNSPPEIVADIVGTVSNDSNHIAYTKRKLNDWGIEPRINVYNIKGKGNESIELAEDSTNKFVTGWSPRDNLIILQNEAQSPGSEVAQFYDVSTKKLVFSLSLYTYTIEWLDEDNFIFLSKVNNEVTINKFSLIDLSSSIMGTFKNINNPIPNINNVYLINKELQVSTSNFKQIPTEDIGIKYSESKNYYKFNILNGEFTVIKENDFFENKILTKFHSNNKDNYRIEISKKYSDKDILINIYPKVENLNEDSVLIDLNSSDLSNSYILSK